MMTPPACVLTGGLLIDAASPRPRPADVVVAAGRIQEVQVPGAWPVGRPGRGETGAGGPAPAGARPEVIDLAGAYLLPGLWDVHTHIGRGIPDAEARDELPATRTIRAGRDCIAALGLGITSLRVVGEQHFLDVAWKRAFEAGWFAGPSLYTCGYFITTTAGHFLRSGCALEVDGPVGFRRAIREQIKNGVDFIKLNMTGGVMGPPWDGMPDTFPLPDEIESAFALCRRRGFKVVAHAGGTDGIKAAVRAGAHTIEHGYQLDDEAVAMMAERGTYYVPTLGLTHLNRGRDFAASDPERAWVGAHPLREDYRLRAVAAAPAHAAGFQKALAAGVKIACGSDLALPDGGLLELAMLVRCGMTPWQAIVAASRTAAEVCGVASDCGTIEPGKRADLIAVRGNPLDDIDRVRSLALVMKRGTIVVRS